MATTAAGGRSREAHAPPGAGRPASHPRGLLWNLPAWVWGLHGLIVWIAIEDTVRKFLMNSLLVYGVKDVLTALVLAGALRTPGGRRAVQFVPRTLVLVMVWGLVLHLLGSLNPELVSWLVAANGLRLTFVYVPLILVGIAYVLEGHDPLALLRTLVATGTLAAGVGLWQALLDPSFLNPAPVDELAGLQIGMTRAEGVPYVASTFLSPGRYVTFLLVAVGSGLAASLLERGRRPRALMVVALGLFSLGLLTSGARLGIIALALVAAAYVLLLHYHRRRTASPADRGAARGLLPLLGLGVLAFILVVAFSERVQRIAGFYGETLASEEGGIASRAEVNLAFLKLDADTWLFGHGTGSASFGIQYIVPDVQFAIEGGYGSIVWELGFLGLAFYVALAAQLSTVYLASPASRPRRSTPLAAALGAVFLFALWVLNLLGAVLQQYVLVIPMWLFTGVLLAERRSARA